MATTILASDMSGFSTDHLVYGHVSRNHFDVPTLPIPETDGARTGALELCLKTLVLSSSCFSLMRQSRKSPRMWTHMSVCAPK